MGGCSDQGAEAPPDVYCRHVEGLLSAHVGFFPVRIANDRELFLRHRMLGGIKALLKSRFSLYGYATPSDLV
jgi:hypothetical protein